jgi:Fe-S cluster assembly scaffold protein SufB
MPLGQNPLPTDTFPNQYKQELNKSQPSTQIDDNERLQKLKALGFGAPVDDQSESKTEDFEQLEKTKD